MNLHTDRLYIRPVNEADSQAMFAYRSDTETNKFLSLIPESVDDVAEFISKTSLRLNIPGTWFQVVLIERSSDLLIGDIGIHFLETDTQIDQVEIGYTLSKNFRGKGYATEALTEIIDYLIHHLQKHRVIASIDPANRASIKLMERLGFRREAHFVKSLFFRGEWVDDLIYAILADEWKNRNNI